MLLVSKKKIGGNRTFFRDNKASILPKGLAPLGGSGGMPPQKIFNF